MRVVRKNTSQREGNTARILEKEAPLPSSNLG